MELSINTKTKVVQHVEIKSWLIFKQTDFWTYVDRIMQPIFTVVCIGCKNTRLIIIIEDGFIKAGDNLDEDVLIDVNDNHNNKYNMSAIVRMISKLLKNTYKIIVLGSVVLLQLKWRYLTLRKFSPYYESQMKNVTKYKSFSFVTDMRNSPFSPLQTIFNWEPPLWTLMSVAWVWWMMMSKKTHCHFHL